MSSDLNDSGSGSYLVPVSQGPITVSGPTSDPQPFSANDDQTLAGLLRILKRRWKAVMLVFLATVLLGIGACLWITPQYAATATIEINKDDQTEDTAARDASAAQTPDEMRTELQTDVIVLQNDGLALGVIQDCNLMSKAPFSNIAVESEAGKPLDQAPQRRERAIRLFEKKLKVDSPPDTRLLSVTFRNPDPIVAAEVANRISDRFIEGTLERRHNSTTHASYWLQKQLDALKKQVEESEQRLAKYEQKTGIAGVQISASGGGNGSPNVSISPQNTVTDRLFSLNQELTTAEANRISAETVYHLVESQDPEVVLGLGAASGGSGGSAALTQDQGIQFVRTLRAAEASLMQDYASSAVKYGANNPRLIQVQQQLEEVRKQMKAELQRISKRAENAYLYAKQNEDSIRRQFTSQQSAADVLADQNVQLQILAQEAYSNRAIYESLYSKLKTASLASGVRATRIDIVNPAQVPGVPVVPQYPVYMSVIAAAGVLLGVSSAFIRESFDESVRTSRDLRDLLDVPFLAYIPTLKRSRRHLSTAGAQRKLLDSPRSPFSEAFRSLRTAVMVEMADFRRKSLMVTSAVTGDGKTTVTYNLGVVLAQQGARVLLIDGDLRNPTLHRLFGCENAVGLADMLTARTGAEIAGIVPHAALPGLSMLPSGRALDLPAEFLASEQFADVLQTSESQYDYVLIDSPPVLSVTDAAVIATKVAGVIAVLRSGSTTRPILASLVAALRRTATPIVGTLLNDVRDPARDGFYDYGYSRQKGEHVHVIS